jgi:hypothetical protein
MDEFWLFFIFFGQSARNNGGESFVDITYRIVVLQKRKIPNEYCLAGIGKNQKKIPDLLYANIRLLIFMNGICKLPKLLINRISGNASIQSIPQ